MLHVVFCCFSMSIVNDHPEKSYFFAQDLSIPIALDTAIYGIKPLSLIKAIITGLRITIKGVNQL